MLKLMHMALNAYIITFIYTATLLTLKPSIEFIHVYYRYERAGVAAPEVIYIDKGCCRQNGPSSIDLLFQRWVDAGMVARLDVWHFMHRFDAAVTSEAHIKYTVFKSALSGAIFAYNGDDLDKLVTALRAGLPPTDISDDEVIKRFAKKDDLQHYVRRVTVGAQESFRLITDLINDLKGPAGKDESGNPLFTAEIDNVWKRQQRHLECIQDPPGMSLYLDRRKVTRHGVELTHFKCARGSNSIESFHMHLPQMIPGPHCAAKPFQVSICAINKHPQTHSLI